MKIITKGKETHFKISCLTLALILLSGISFSVEMDSGTVPSGWRGAVTNWWNKVKEPGVKKETAPSPSVVEEKKADIIVESPVQPKPAEGEQGAVAIQPVLKRYTFSLNIMDRYNVKRKYGFKDFGFEVDEDLAINEFYSREPLSSPNKTFPAQEAGLRLLDKVININGLSTYGMSRAEAMNLIGSHRYSKFAVERVLK